MKQIALGAGTMALVWSFALPAAIRKAQLARLDDEVEKRRAAGRLPPTDDEVESVIG